MGKKPQYPLYTVNHNVMCVKCDHVGAIQFYGNWYPKGLGDKVGDIVSFEEYRNKEFMSHAAGFGGTIPWECTNCGNKGLIDFGGLEGYKMAFKTIKPLK